MRKIFLFFKLLLSLVTTVTVPTATTVSFSTVATVSITTIATVSAPVVAKAQSRSITEVTYMSSTGYKAILYQPAGRDTKGNLPFIMVGGGSGTRGTNPQLMLIEGLMKAINNGYDLDAYVLAIQVPISVNAYADSHIDAGYNYAIANLAIDDKRCYVTGLSFGGSMSSTAINSHPERWAGAILVAGNTILRSNLTQAQINVPQYHFAGSYESFRNNHLLYIDSALTKRPMPVILPEMRCFFGDHTATVWDAVYGDFNKWFGWLKLHHLNRDTTAEQYMDSLEAETNWEKKQDMYFKTARIVQFMNSGAFKTSLQTRLNTQKALILPGKYALLDFGLSTNPSSGNVNNMPNMAAGTSYTNLVNAVDGSNTGWSFTINSEGAGTEEAGNGFPGPYHYGMDSVNGFIDQWWNFNAGGNMTIGGLTVGKTYTFSTTGMSRKLSQTQPQGARITINGVTKEIPYQEVNTDQYITFTGLVPNASGQIVITFRSVYSYECYLSDAIIVEEGDAPPPPTVTLTVPDVSNYGLKQKAATTILNPPFTVTGNISSYTWTKLSGPTGQGTITSPNSATPGITFDLNGEGTYTFRLTVSDGTNSAQDDFVVTTRNWQKKNEIPCRTGAPVTWTLTPTFVVDDSKVDVKYAFLRRDGRDIRGGDIILIDVPAGDSVHHLYLGDLGGSPGCPDTIRTVRPLNFADVSSSDKARFHFGKNNADTDSNAVNHVIFDGACLQDQGIKYAFRFTGTGFGVTARFISNVTFRNCYFGGSSTGMSIKMFSDSTKPWTIHDNFIQKNIKILNCYFENINANEAIYEGVTDPAGNQDGNDGPTVRMDSTEIAYNFFRRIAWDAIQTSASNYTEIHDNIVLEPAFLGASSQNWGILAGGLTRARIYNNLTWKGNSGTIGTLGYGDAYIFNNAVIWTTGNAMYYNQTVTGILEYNQPGGLPPLKINVNNNILARFADRAVVHQNASGLADVGVIENNYFVDSASRTQTQLVTTNAGDVVNNNTVVSSFPVDIESLGSITDGPIIKITQGSNVDTFTTAKEAYDWLWDLISGGPLPNELPTVNVGANVTVTLPTTAAIITGTASDIDGTISTTAWSFISGPATPSITNSAALTTTVTGLTTAGVYTFRLTATDNDGGAQHADITVTVLPATELKLMNGRKVKYGF